METGGNPGNRSPSRPVILLVDDELSIVQILEAGLRFSGYGAIVARRGEEAVEVFRRDGESISAVVLDLTLPDMAGEKVGRLLTEIDPEVRIIFTSGYGAGEIGDDLLSGRGRAFLPKPFGIRELVRKIREVLEAEP